MDRRTFVRLTAGSAMVALMPGMTACTTERTVYRTAPPAYPPEYYRYYYYPNAGVYYQVYTGFYFYFFNGAWRRTRQRPVFLNLDRRTRVIIVIRDERPYDRHREHERRYPPRGPRYSRDVEDSRWQDEPQGGQGSRGRLPDDGPSPGRTQGQPPDRRLPPDQDQRPARGIGQPDDRGRGQVRPPSADGGQAQPQGPRTQPPGHGPDQAPGAPRGQGQGGQGQPVPRGQPQGTGRGPGQQPAPARGQGQPAPQGQPQIPQGQPRGPQGQPPKPQARPPQPHGQPSQPQPRPSQGQQPQGRPPAPRGRPPQSQGQPQAPVQGKGKLKLPCEPGDEGCE